MSDCRFGVSLVNYPDADPDHKKSEIQKMKKLCVPCKSQLYYIKEDWSGLV